MAEPTRDAVDGAELTLGYVAMWVPSLCRAVTGTGPGLVLGGAGMNGRMITRSDKCIVCHPASPLTANFPSFSCLAGAWATGTSFPSPSQGQLAGRGRSQAPGLQPQHWVWERLEEVTSGEQTRAPQRGLS